MRKGLTILALLLLLVGCGSNNANEKQNIVYVTIYPIEFIVDYLIGEHIEVVSIIPLGGDAHSYVPTQKQMNDIIESDIFIYLGLGLEEAAHSIEDAIINEEVVTLELGSLLDMDHDSHEEEHEDHEHGEHDNHHIWVDPEYMIDMATIVKEQLVKYYPEYETDIVKNYQNLINDLKQVDELYRDTLSDTRIDTFIVTHDAFKHLEKYGINSLAIKDESHSKDPTQKEMSQIIEKAEQLGITYIVYEQNIPCLPADIIKSELNANRIVLHNLSVRTLTDLEGEKDFIDLMLDNLEVLKTILN